MKFSLLCKRYYTNKDLLKDRFGRLYHLPVQLGARGHEGYVLAVDYRSNESAALREENVAFHSLPFRPHRPIAALRGVYRRLGEFRPDIVIASGDTHLGFLGLVLARRLGVPFAFDVYDDYTAFASGRIPGMKWLFYQVVHRADLVICANPILCARLSSSNPAACVIENGVDPDLFHPLEKSMARSALGLPQDEAMIGFFGSIETNRGVDTLIEAGRRVAVLAVDPTRRRTGGALLGDRIRMNSLRSERVYMRSIATRRQHLATSEMLGDHIQFLKSKGFDLVIV